MSRQRAEEKAYLMKLVVEIIAWRRMRWRKRRNDVVIEVKRIQDNCEIRYEEAKRRTF